jgi:hypothetical protein
MTQRNSEHLLPPVYKEIRSTQIRQHLESGPSGLRHKQESLCIREYRQRHP